MRHWQRSVHLGDELGEYLGQELERRWPQSEYPYHIEVVASQIAGQLEVRVWNSEGVHVVTRACPVKFLNSTAKSPTVAAVLHAIDSAVTLAGRESGK